MIRGAALMAQNNRSDKVPLKQAFEQLYARQSPRFVLWLPVAMGAGIWAYFAAAQEPPVHWAALPVLPAMILATGLARRAGWGLLAVCWLALMMTAGFSLALWSAHRAAAPAIAYPVGETVEGRVLELSRSASGAPRLLLDDVILYGIEPGATPARVRLTVLEPPPSLPRPGERVRVYATLMPPGEPVEPGAFDFNRRAFFARLGGVGLTRGELVRVPVARTGLADRARIWVAAVRERLSRALRANLPGPPGAFAAAIIVGDRVDIEDRDAEALRVSNLAHLLAISGLHMGILTGLVFSVVRLGLALVPQIALRWPTKKLAAVSALAAGAAYLVLSGSTIATQRAFIMVAVALAAVLLDRPAITLRALALAAIIILAMRPISLLDAGFQMSFAATVALVAGFEALPARSRKGSGKASWPRWVVGIVIVYVGGLLLSSLLAGTATAPIAAYHFNRMAPYGLLANLLAVPVMGLWIAPWACLAAVLAPLGQAGPALAAMGAGIEAVLWVAHWVGNLPGAVAPVQAAAPLVLALLSLGGLWLVIWQGWGRLAGLAVVGLAVGLWSNPAPRPEVLIAPGARLIGVMSAEGRALDHHSAQSFAARTWLRRDGDWTDQETAAARPMFERSGGRISATLSHGWRLEAYWGRGATEAALQTACLPRTLLIARNGPRVSGDCTYLGKRALARAGAIAIHATETRLEMTRARKHGHRRLWTQGTRGTGARQ